MLHVTCPFRLVFLPRVPTTTWYGDCGTQIIAKAVGVLAEMAAQAHQIAEASLFSPKQYWRASALLCSLILGLPAGSASFLAATGALRSVHSLASICSNLRADVTATLCNRSRSVIHGPCIEWVTLREPWEAFESKEKHYHLETSVHHHSVDLANKS